MKSSAISKNKGLIYVLISALLFSTGGLLIKLCTWSPITINGTRSIIAALFMFIVLKKSKHVFVVNRHTIGAAIVASCMNYSFVTATKLTSAGNAIVLQFTQPVFIILLTWLIFKLRPSKAAIVACGVIFIGILCAFFDQLSLDGFLGNMLAVFSGVTYATIFMFKRMKNVDFESAMLYSFVLSFFVCLPWLFAEQSHPPQNILIVVLLGTFQMGLAYFMLGKGLSVISPITASLTSTIEPVLNPILVAVFYGEQLGVLAIIGGIIVISASTIYNIYESKKENIAAHASE